MCYYTCFNKANKDYYFRYCSLTQSLVDIGVIHFRVNKSIYQVVRFRLYFDKHLILIGIGVGNFN